MCRTKDSWHFLHKWSKWEQINAQTKWVWERTSRGEIVQVRRCEHCNKIQIGYIF